MVPGVAIALIGILTNLLARAPRNLREDRAVEDLELRARIYGHFAVSGRAPPPAMVAGWVGGEAEAAGALRRLHDAHALVLDADGVSIRMALPFSGVPTDHVVRSGERSWFANCAWDALAIPAALGGDGDIEARWLDDDEQVDLAVSDGRLSHTHGFVHFTIPARHWWDDIVET